VIWRSGDLGSGFTDLAIYRFTDLAIWRFGDLAIWRFGDLAIWQSKVVTWRSVFRITKSPNH